MYQTLFFSDILMCNLFSLLWKDGIRFTRHVLELIFGKVKCSFFPRQTCTPTTGSTARSRSFSAPRLTFVCLQRAWSMWTRAKRAPMHGPLARGPLWGCHCRPGPAKRQVISILYGGLADYGRLTNWPDVNSFFLNNEKLFSPTKHGGSVMIIQCQKSIERSMVLVILMSWHTWTNLAQYQVLNLT